MPSSCEWANICMIASIPSTGSMKEELQTHALTLQPCLYGGRVKKMHTNTPHQAVKVPYTKATWK